MVKRDDEWAHKARFADMETFGGNGDRDHSGQAKKFRPQLYDVAAAEAGKLPVRSCVQVTASSSCWRTSDQISWQERTAKVNRAFTWAKTAEGRRTRI